MARTALFNWAYARHTGGTFVFRIEDTDPARDSEESYLQLLDALRWLGLDWDEGVEVGGPFGPYRQSERGDLYRQTALRLLDGGHAYESFSTPEEVAARHVAAGRSPHEGYDGHDRTLTAAQRSAYLDEGRRPVLRVKMPDDDVEFDDLVRGRVVFKAGSVPDFAITRAGGAPLYTLTNPLDDSLMRITDVLRGEDLLSSTPRQIVLHRALAELGVAPGPPPRFGHLPYVMGEGNKKLSKRDPKSDLRLLRDQGFLPEGLVNYLALLGWSLSADRDVFTPEELAREFDVRQVGESPARFDLKKAEAINAAHVRLLDPVELARRMTPYLHAAGLVDAPRLESLDSAARELLEAAAPLVQERLTLLDEAPGKLDFFFQPDDSLVFEPAALARLAPDAGEVLRESLEALARVEPWACEPIHQALTGALVEGLGLKPRDAFAPLRVALTGKRVSPPLFESMELLGRESCRVRIEALATSEALAAL
jgi:glutamyl-tRNA synthetase